MKRAASNEVLVTVDPDGSVHVPAGVCESLGLLRGDEALISLHDGHIELTPSHQATGAYHFGRWRSISHALVLEGRQKTG